MFKTIFSEHNKIWGLLPSIAPRGYGLGHNHRQKVFHWGTAYLCRG